MQRQEETEKRETATSPLDDRLGPIPPDLAALDGDGEDGEKLPTLGEVGKRLPIGFVDARGERHLDFELVDWTYEVEESLGDLAEKHREMTLSAYMSEVIATGLARVGSIETVKLKRSERRLLVRRLYFSDALYVYLWVRIAALGRGLKFDEIRCNCGHVLRNFSADLESVEVKAFDAVPSRTVELEQGVLLGGKRLKRFTVGPVRWALLEDHPDALLNAAKLKLVSIQQGVTTIEGAEGSPILTSGHLRTMRTVEINRLVSEIDACGGGPVMEVRDRCPKCRGEFRRAIPWTYDDFFAVSSQ